MTTREKGIFENSLRRVAILMLVLFISIEGRAQSVLDGFDPGANAAPLTLAIQSDGKILVGGGFTTLGGGGGGTTARHRIGRLHPDGTLDITFDPGANGSVLALAVQADGKILVGGDFTLLGGGTRNRIARLNPDGSLDTGFNPGANGIVTALALQADGKILIGGEFTGVGGGAGTTTRHNLGRLNPDGTVDTNFNPGANSLVYAMAVQPDGKILVVGNFTTIGGGGTGATARNYIARLHPGGSVDAAFNPGANAYSYALSLQADGKILVTGDFTLLGGGGSGTAARSRIGRLNPNGSIDAGFNPGANGGINALLVQADGRILLGGGFTTLGGGGTGTTPRNRIGRLKHDGSVDASFNPGADARVYAVAEQADGNLLAVGSFTTLGGGGTGSAARSKIARLYPDGTVDATCDPGVGLFGPAALAVQPDGKIVVGGHFETLGGGGSGTATRYNLGRLNPDGSLDAGFDTGTNASVQASATQADGKVIISGFFDLVFGNNTGPYQREFIARFNQDGTVDAGFNPGANGDINTIALQADGKILVGGTFTTLGGGGSGITMRNYIGRLNSDGSLDTSFDPGANSEVSAIALQADGKILVGGTFATLGGGGSGNNVRHHIARLNPNGTIDTAFNPGADGEVLTFATQADGKILVGGSFTQLAGSPRFNFGRLHADGSIDAGFNPGTGFPSTLAVQSDGRILVANGGGNPIKRLNADGTVDSGFDADTDGGVDILILQANGKIMVGGRFGFLRGAGEGMVSRKRVGRLTNPTPAFQSVDVSSAGTTITWNRSGASPELAYATFELSNDAVNYTALPNPVRVSGGWQLNGLSLPSQQNLFIRARGFYSTGRGNSSGSMVETVRNVFLSPQLTPTQVVSQKTHGAASFDIDLPLTGSAGVECRSGGANGDHTLIFSFPNPLVSVAGAGVTNGVGSVSGSSIGNPDARKYVVNLTGVANAQEITITLTNLSDGAGNSSTSVPISMGVLLGDTNGNGSVNASDVSLTKLKSGQPVDATNFRSDVTVSNSINSSDVSTVKSKSGTALP